MRTNRQQQKQQTLKPSREEEKKATTDGPITNVVAREPTSNMIKINLGQRGQQAMGSKNNVSLNISKLTVNDESMAAADKSGNKQSKDSAVRAFEIT